MFAKLKKKIEEEVGDSLTLLTSSSTQIIDRRVSSSQTPSQISRQSSVGSLIDIDGQQSTSRPQPSPSSSSLNVPLTPTSASAGPQQVGQGEPSYSVGDQIKKLNNEWSRKFENQKKLFEEKLQNQEADFAWKLSSKNDEVEKLRDEKKRLEDNLKNIEVKFKDKLIRAQDDIDNLEGMSKMENSKVKHLLLNTQEEMERLRAKNFEHEDVLQQLQSELQVLRVENELLNKNLDKSAAHHLNHGHGGGGSGYNTSNNNSNNNYSSALSSPPSSINSSSETWSPPPPAVAEKEKEFDLKISTLAKSHEEDLKKKCEMIEILEKELKEIQVEMKNLKSENSLLHKEVKGRGGAVDLLEKTKIDMTQKLSHLNSELNEKDQSLKDLGEKNAKLQNQIQKMVDNSSTSAKELSDKVEDLRSRLSNSDQLIETLVKEKEDLSFSLNSCQIEASNFHQELNTKMMSQKEELDQIKLEKNELLKEKEKLSDKISTIESNSNAVIQQTQELITQLSNCQNQIKSLETLQGEDKLLEQSLQDQIVSQRQAITQLQEENNQYSSTISQLQSTNDRLRIEVTEAHNQLSQNMTEDHDFNAELVSLKNVNKELKTDKENLQEAISKIKGQLVETRSEFDEKVKENSIKLSKIEELIKDKENLDGTISKLKVQLLEVKSQLDEKVKENSVTLNKIKELDSLVKTLSASNDKSKSIIQELTLEKTHLEKLQSKLGAELNAVKVEKVQLINEKCKLDEKLGHSEALRSSLEAERLGSQKIIDDLNTKMKLVEKNLNQQIETSTRLGQELNAVKVEKDQLINEKCKLDEKINQSEGSQKIIDDLITKMKVLEKNLNQQIETSTRLGQELNAVKVEKDQLISEKSKLKSQSDSLNSSFEAERLGSQKIIDDLNTKMKLLEKNMNHHIDKLQLEKNELLVKIEQLEIVEINSKETSDQLVDQLSSTQNQIEALESEFRAISLENKSFIGKINQLEIVLQEHNNKSQNASEADGEIGQKYDQLLAQFNEQEDNFTKLQQENYDYLIQVSDLQSLKDELQEEIEFLKEGKPELDKKVEDLEVKLAEKAKALKNSHQQLQDLRKSLAQEIKSGNGQPNDLNLKPMSIEVNNSIPNNSTSNLAASSPPMLEISLSSEMQNKKLSYQEDANYQYMRSVLVKYITSRDPHVTRHMRKVVTTLLQLNPEEERLLKEASSEQKNVFSILKS